MRIKIDKLNEGENLESFSQDEVAQALSGDKNILKNDGLSLRIEKNRDFLHATGSFAVSYEDVCDRCAVKYVRELIVNIDYYFHVGEIGGEKTDDVEIVRPEESNGELILDDYARESFILAQPFRSLCSPECKGLCPRCGTDLNRGICTCPNEDTPDPRWEVLTKLLNKDK